MTSLFNQCANGEHMLSENMPLIGDIAPAFRATTTNGDIVFPDDFSGKWVVFFSHPSDFTPVCTSEFIVFQETLNEFKNMNTELLGLSIGSIPSHLAWIRAIQEISNVEITFPIIADVNMAIARKYGMIAPAVSNTHAVRAVFIIDPSGTIRAILYYPAILGRCIDEIKRAVLGLQTADKFGVSIPADWTAGRDVLVNAPATADALRKTDNKSPWFLAYKKLPESEIYAKIYKKQNGNK